MSCGSPLFSLLGSPLGHCHVRGKDQRRRVHAVCAHSATPQHSHRQRTVHVLCQSRGEAALSAVRVNRTASRPRLGLRVAGAAGALVGIGAANPKGRNEFAGSPLWAPDAPAVPERGTCGTPDGWPRHILAVLTSIGCGGEPYEGNRACPSSGSPITPPLARSTSRAASPLPADSTARVPSAAGHEGSTRRIAGT